MKEKIVLSRMRKLTERIDALESKRRARAEAKELVAIMGGDTEDSEIKSLSQEIQGLKTEIREYYRSLHLLTKMFVFGKYGRYL